MADVVNSLFIKQDGKFYDLYDLPDGFVIKGDLDLSGKGLTKLPDLSKVIVEGSFRCQNNQLTSLQGAPQEVGGKIKVDINISAQYSFNDGEIKLDDLKNSPLYREEIFISEKSKELRRKVLRTIAAENVSPEKGVVNKKRTAGEKNAIKQILDGIGKSIDK